MGNMKRGERVGVYYLDHERRIAYFGYGVYDGGYDPFRPLPFPFGGKGIGESGPIACILLDCGDSVEFWDGCILFEAELGAALQELEEDGYTLAPMEEDKEGDKG